MTFMLLQNHDSTLCTNDNMVISCYDDKIGFLKMSTECSVLYSPNTNLNVVGKLTIRF